MSAKNKGVSKEMLQRWEERKNIILSRHYRISGNEAERSVRIARARKDYGYFVQTYFPSIVTCESAPFHLSAAREIREKKRLRKVYKWARGMAKSSNMGTLIPLWLLIQEQPDFRFMVLVSKSEDAATGLLQDVQLEIEENTALRDDFGNLKGSGDWTDKKFTTANGCTFTALGRGQSPRGLKKRGNRPDYILIDDIDDDELVKNHRRVDQVEEWCMSALFGTMQAGRGRFIVVGNLIHKYSVLAKIAARVTFEVSRVDILDKNGRPSWASNHTLEEINALRLDMGERHFNKEYMNEPSQEGTVFKRKWLRWDKMLPLREYAALVAYTDPSWKSSTKNDYKATCLLGKTRDGYYHVIKMFADQTTVAAMVQWHYDIDAYVDGKKPVRYMMEANMIQELMIEEFKKVGAACGHQIPVIPDSRKKPDKFSRIEALQPLFERGLVIFNKDEKSSRGFAVLEEQLIGFERGSAMHDDAPDALEGGIFALNRRSAIAGATYRSSTRRDRSY